MWAFTLMRGRYLSLIFSVFSFLIITNHNANASVVGEIQSVEKVGGTYFIKGYACETQTSTSISVHVYLNGGAGSGGTVLKPALANLVTTDSVAQSKCQGTNHNFAIPLTDSELEQHAGKIIYIHGISSLSPNFLIEKSGVFSIPNISTSIAKGVMSPIQLVNGQHMVRGWACLENVDSSIAVDLYVGGAKGQGLLLKSQVLANSPSESAINSLCNTSLTSKHRFVIPFSDEELTLHGTKSVYMYVSGTESQLTNSGKYTLPYRDLPNPPSEEVGTPLSSLVTSGKDYTIAAGQVAYIDKSIDMGILNVMGELKCPSDDRKLTLRLSGLHIMGQFNCGSAEKRFSGELDLVLKGGVPLMSMGERAIGVMAPGVVRLYGQEKNSGWQRLALISEAGSNKLVLRAPVQWSPGDTVVVSSSGFNPYEAETAIVDQVINERTVLLKSPLQYKHWGGLQLIDVPNKRWILDESSSVANLNRNIRIYPDGPPSSHNFIGAHFMVMKGAQAYIDSVEFFHMGQMGKMGRYPFHWHRAGNVSGQYIVNSSIHDTYQRCITVHGTQEALIKNNVCYNHFGHGFFLEDGNETRNRIEGNLGILSKRVPQARALLASDFTGVPDRFSAPATFWISNPNNYVVGNIAAGSEGTGFWMAFTKGIKCDETKCEFNTSDPNHRPINDPTWAFHSNVAHSSEIGITWDGAPDGALTNNPNNPNDRMVISAHYAPNYIPIFSNLITYKNANTGIYFRGTTVEFHNNVNADNGATYFFAFNQVVKNSVVIAESQNFSVTEREALYTRNSGRPMRGALIYDGPFDFQGVDFVFFPDKLVLHRGVDFTPVVFSAIGGANRYTNSTQGLRFFPEPYKKLSIGKNFLWKDSLWSISLEDQDGTLTGTPQTIVVPDHPFNLDPTCNRNSSWGALLCMYRVGQIVLLSKNINNVPFAVERNDGARTIASANSMVGQPHRKFNVILHKDYEYVVEFPNGVAPKEVNGIYFQAEKKGITSPVVKLEGLGQRCVMLGSIKTSSLQELRNTATNAFYEEGHDLYVRLKTTKSNPNVSSDNGYSGLSSGLNFVCN